MIECCLKNRDLNEYIVILPHEINNEFLGNARRAAELGKIEGVVFIPSFNDFSTPVEYSVDKLDKLYKDFEVLEQNLDKIIEIVPLPEKVGGFDGMFYVGYRTNIGFQNRVALGTGGYKNFNKEDMLYLIGLIKKKILEAKEKGEPLVFSGD